MNKRLDEILTAFERPGTLFDWMSPDKDIMKNSDLPLKIIGTAKGLGSLDGGDPYPIDDGHLPLRNMIILTYLDFDAVMEHVTNVKFDKPLGEKAFMNWYMDMELGDPKTVDYELKRKCFQLSYRIPPFQKIMGAVKKVASALFTEYMMNHELQLCFNGSAHPVFTGEKVVIVHYPK